jgi:hypothetical protein
VSDMIIVGNLRETNRPSSLLSITIIYCWLGRGNSASEGRIEKKVVPLVSLYDLLYGSVGLNDLNAFYTNTKREG